MRGHLYQACTPSINRHAGFAQTYEFKSVSKADSLKFGTHPDQATRTAAIENVDQHDSSKRRGRRVMGHSKQWRSRIWCLSPTHTGRRTISPLALVCPLPSTLCWDAHRPLVAASASSSFTEADTRSDSAEHVGGNCQMTAMAKQRTVDCIGLYDRRGSIAPSNDRSQRLGYTAASGRSITFEFKLSHHSSVHQVTDERLFP